MCYIVYGILRHECSMLFIGFSVYIETGAGEVEVGAFPAALVVTVAIIGTAATAVAVVQ